MKISTMLIFGLIIILSISLWENTSNVNPESGDITSYNYTDADSTSNYTSNYLWYTMLHPSNWSSDLDKQQKGNFFYWFVSIFLIGAGLSTIVAGLFRITPSDTTNFTGLAILLIAVMGWPCWLLYSFLTKELAPIMCGAASFCYMPVFLVTTITAAIEIIWIFMVIKFWRTGFSE